MHVQLRFFASVREILETAQESILLPEHVRTVGDVRHFLCGRGGVWEKALNEKQPLRMACNQEMATPAMSISDGCEIAFFPPVTGG